MMARWVLFLWAVIILGVVSPANAATTCNGGSAGAMSCPMMDMSGNQPAMTPYKLPAPIGTIQIPSKVYFFSGPLCLVDYSIRTTMEGLYAAFSDAFLTPVRVILMLYVCVYAISFMFGLVNPRGFVMQLLRMTAVWVLISDHCTFYNYVYGGFIAASNDLAVIMSNVGATQGGTCAPSGPANDGDTARKQLYQSLDCMFKNIVGVGGLIGLGTLMLSSFTGDGQGLTSGMLGMLGFGSMALAMFRALVTLGIALAATAFFLLFAPIFLSMSLFQNTRRLFDNWLAMLISFTLQPFIIIAFLGVARVTIDKASPSGANINSLVENMVQLVSSQPFQPSMMQGKPVMNRYRPSAKAIQALGANLNPPLQVNPCPNDEGDVSGCDTQVQIQEKFFNAFTPKLMFWFLINMVMAGFIKEVPGLAQRISGFISATPLGSTADSSFSRLSQDGLVLPGISRGAGGEMTSMLKSSLMKNTQARNVAIGSLGMGTAMGLEKELRGKDATRDAPAAANQAAVGEAGRDKPNVIRVGTLGELLGDKTAGRDGMRVDGIGSEAKASREGPNVVGVGVEGGAARRDTMLSGEKISLIDKPIVPAPTAEELRQRMQENAERIAADKANIKRGVDTVNQITGMNFKAPEGAQAKTVARDINLRDVEMMRVGEGNTTYVLNGKEISVKRAEEEHFLTQKIDEFKRDASKAGIMGARGAAEYKTITEQSDRLEHRLRVVLAEKRTLESAQLEQEKQIISSRSSSEMKRLQEELPKIVEKNDIAALNKKIEQLQASGDRKSYAQLLMDLNELRNAMAGKIEVAQRQEIRGVNLDGDAPLRVKVPGEIADIAMHPRIAENQVGIIAQMSPAPPPRGSGGEMAESSRVRELQANVLKEMADVASKQNDEKVTQEMADMATRLPGIVHKHDTEEMGNMVAQMRASEHAKDYEGAINELNQLRQRVEEEDRQRALQEASAAQQRQEQVAAETAATIQLEEARLAQQQRQEMQSAAEAAAKLEEARIAQQQAAAIQLEDELLARQRQETQAAADAAAAAAAQLEEARLAQQAAAAAGGTQQAAFVKAEEPVTIADMLGNLGEKASDYVGGILGGAAGMGTASEKEADVGEHVVRQAGVAISAASGIVTVMGAASEATATAATVSDNAAAASGIGAAMAAASEAAATAATSAAVSEDERIAKQRQEMQAAVEAENARMIAKLLNPEAEAPKLATKTEEPMTLANTLGNIGSKVGDYVGGIFGGAAGGATAGAEGSASGSEAGGNVLGQTGEFIGRQVGAVGDTVLNTVGWAMGGVKSEAIVETAVSGAYSLGDSIVGAVGGTIGVSKEAVYETAGNYIQDLGTNIGIAGREMADGGQEIGGITGTVISAVGGAMMAAVGEKPLEGPKATEESFESYVQRNLDQATGGIIGKDVKADALMGNMTDASAGQAGQNVVYKKETKKIPNPKWDPNNPDAEPREIETTVDVAVVVDGSTTS